MSWVKNLEVKILEEDEISIRVRFKNIPLEYMNAIRRFIMVEVPTLAIDSIAIIENTSPLYDEVLAHRLGLVPLKVKDITKYKLPEECEGQEDYKCHVLLVLDAQAVDHPRTVYSGELVSEDPDVKPLYDNIPIARLAPGQKIKLEAYARLGRGKEHAKWQPVSASTIKPHPEVIVKNPRGAGAEKAADACPVNILRMGRNGLEVTNEYKCTYCMECVEKAPDVIEVKERENDYVLYVESVGTLPSRQIISMGVKELEKSLSELEKLVEGLNVEPAS